MTRGSRGVIVKARWKYLRPSLRSFRVISFIGRLRQVRISGKPLAVLVRRLFHGRLFLIRLGRAVGAVGGAGIWRDRIQSSTSAFLKAVTPSESRRGAGNFPALTCRHNVAREKGINSSNRRARMKPLGGKGIAWVCTNRYSTD